MKKRLHLIMSFALVLLLSAGIQSFVSAADVDWSDFEADEGKHLTDNPDKVWTVTFSQPVKQDSVNEGNVKVTTKTGVLVETEADVESNKIIVKPMKSYEVGQSYYLYIGPGILSESGKEQASNVRFEFTVVEKSKDPNLPKKVQSVTDEGIQIDGQTYSVSPHLTGILKASNHDALIDAEITFTHEGNLVTDIQGLRLVNGGQADSNRTFDGGNATIAGSLSIAADYYEVKNLNVEEDLTITGAVEKSFSADQLNVAGTVHVEEDAQQQQFTAFDSLTGSTPEQYTKAKIVFHDSTVVYIDIAKWGTDFSATGETRVTSMRLSANADIYFNPEVILPNVEITKGVTKIDLNVTIKEIIIDSTEDVQLTGSGNFENVTINSNKNVSFETKGTIGTLKTGNGGGTVTLGENISVSDIVLPDGKKPAEVINNYDAAKGQIEKIDGDENPDYTPPTPEPGGHFAAGVLRVPDRYGYVTLNIVNQGTYRVMYQQVATYIYNPTPQIGEKIPEQAVVYQSGDQFPYYWGHDLYVFQVDEADKIVEVKKVSGFYPPAPKYEFMGSTVKITTVLKSKEALFNRDAFLLIATENSIQTIEDLLEKEWGEDDGLPTVTIPLNQPVTSEEKIMASVRFHVTGFTFFPGQGMSEGVVINYLKLVSTTNVDLNITYLRWPLEILTCGQFPESDGEDERCRNGLYLPFENNPISLNAYKEEIRKNVASVYTAEDVKAIIRVVDERLETQLAEYYDVLALVNNLFRENHYDYPYEERLRPGVTQAEINEALAAAERLSEENAEKEKLLREIRTAQNIFDLTQGTSVTLDN